MVTELRELLREAVTAPPAESTDLTAVTTAGRRRVRRRRTALVGVVALATVGVAASGIALRPGATDPTGVSDGAIPVPEGPVLRLADAVPGVEGQDYDVVASHTNRNLNRANGQYFDGVTDDGLLLYRDGPHGIRNVSRLALVDPTTGAEDWLSNDPMVSDLLWPLELGEDRLVFSVQGNRLRNRPSVAMFDRSDRTWHRISWPALPVAEATPMAVGPEGRVYLGVPARRGQPPEGGWPTGPDGEADDAGAEGDTYDLWSASLDDPGDVRDEGLRVGDFDFTDDALVWSAVTNGVNDRIHVRDLASGNEHDFDPQSGERCNLLGFGATGDRIMLSEYCGTYEEGRDDRVQVLSTDGELVTTIQDDSIEGALVSTDGGSDGLVQVTSYGRDTGGTYVYDLQADRFVRVTDSVSSFSMGGPTPPGYLMWDVAVNGRKGATQTIAAWH